MDLSDFLLARIAEDDAAARSATSGPWQVRLHWFGFEVRPGDSWASIPDVISEEIDAADAEHIARHDPARVLAECEAKRRVVELYQRAEARVETENRRVMAGGYPDERGRVGGWDLSALEPVVRLLALPYADHSDYDEAWRP